MSDTPRAKEEARIKAQQELARRILARRNLLHFTQLTLPEYTPGWVHHDVSARLQRFSHEVTEKKSPRLMLLVPPRHGKSELASIRLPAWHLGHNPTHGIINAGYNLDLPMIFSRKVRGLLRDPQYQALFPETRLDPETQATEAWLTDKGGGFVAAGVGGGLTGKGCNVLIIDDPIKNMEEADSADRRLIIDEWYQSTASTRLAPGGGVLLIECMVGDTAVLLADGTERRLDEMRAGDEVMSYEDGRAVPARVVAQKKSGRDFILRIKTSSGKVVRVNGRHPFLTLCNGELRWTRARALTTDHTIVAYPDNGGSGKVRHAQNPDASCPPDAAGDAPATTTKNGGLTGTELLRNRIRRIVGRVISNIATALLPLSTTLWSRPKTGAAPCAGRCQAQRTPPNTGRSCCASTTATTQAPSAGCSATTATSLLDSFELSPLHSPRPSIFEFTTEAVVSVEPDGEDDVYDLQVARTENFIANGLVTHNTWWNWDDLAGRLQARMRQNPEADQFEVVLYPALSEAYEYRDEASPRHEIIRTDEPLEPVPANYTLLRAKDTALHEERYPTEALKRMRANMQPRIWSALYQQSPSPDEGLYFRKEQFRIEPPRMLDPHYRYYTAWDFAIGLKQQNDWTVGATVAHDDLDNVLVQDITRFKGDSFEIVETLVRTAQRYMALSGGNYVVGVEDGQIWRSIAPLVSKRMDELKCYPTIEVMKPLTDKVARARPLQGRMQQGKIIFPEGASWTQVMMNEMLQFPGGAHDDIVDALSWVVRLTVNSAPPRLPTPPKVPSWRDKLAFLGTGQGASHMSA